MDLPSMVQRSGDKLIVRSVVSGNQLYADQGTLQRSNNNNNNSNSNSNNNNISSSSSNNNQNNNNVSTTALAQQNINNNNNKSNQQQRNNMPSMQEMLSGSNVLEQELKRYAQEQFLQQQQKQAAVDLAAAAATLQQQQQQQHHQQQHQQLKQQQQQQQQTQSASMAPQHPVLELKEEGLPQCKIKRNYSCNYCPYFTQNPRYHLTHLRDVHGEKIVINKCKLCLYASRHFQKLVRHMKMVHGCTDGIGGGHGQARGKRGMSREARKRKLEQSVGLDDSVGEVTGTSSVAGVTDMTTLEQFKRELEFQEQKLQREKQAFNKQQEEQLQQQHQQQIAVEAVLAAAYNRQREQQTRAGLDADVNDASVAHHQTRLAAHATLQPTQLVSNRNLEVTSSHSGSTSPTDGGERSTPTYNNSPAGEERPHCRLLKCSVCDFTTLYRTQLHDHEIEEHHKTKFFRCEKCSYVTHIKARFSKHVKYHSMPMIKCVTCDFRTPYKWNLDRHMKNHGGAGPFKCAACDFTADIKQSLTVHEMNHHVPPVGHAAGMAMMGRRRTNKVGATDIGDDFLSDSAELMDDHYNNNNIDDYDDSLVLAETATPFAKKCKYDGEEPTDLSQKGGSSDSSSVHNQTIKRPVPQLIPIDKLRNK